MSEASQVPAEPPVVEELRWNLDRARQGDDSVLPQLREILDTRPELWQYYGDLSLHTQNGMDRFDRGYRPRVEGVGDPKAREMKSELAGPDPSPLELLLADRAVACWLQLSHADAGAAKRRCPMLCKPLDRFLVKGQNGANKRFTTSLGAISTLRRLLPKGPEPDRAV